jgi:hypothetical protein
LKVRETLRIGQRAMFNTVKGRKKVLKVKEYVQEGTLRMEIKREEGKEQIKARRLVRLGSRSKLKVERTGNYRGQAYMLIKYGRLEGRFGQLEIPQEHEIEYGYEGKWIALIPKRRILEARVEEVE